MRKSSRVITYSKLKLENEFLQNWNIDYQCGEYLIFSIEYQSAGY